MKVVSAILMTIGFVGLLVVNPVGSNIFPAVIIDAFLLIALALGGFLYTKVNR